MDIFAFFLFLFMAPYHVDRVLDGDTIKVTSVFSRSQQTIRMLYIDAPEKKQSFGLESKRFLERQILGEYVGIEFHGKEKWGRDLGVVYYRGNSVNFNMVLYGEAWYYPLKNNKQIYQDAQEFAQSWELGLWKNSAAIPPWEFRHNKN